MTKRNQKSRTAEDKEYVALTISRGLLRSELGDKVADKLSDADLQEFAETQGESFLSAVKDDWQWILSESYGLDFDD